MIINTYVEISYFASMICCHITHLYKHEAKEREREKRSWLLFILGYQKGHS